MRVHNVKCKTVANFCKLLTHSRTFAMINGFLKFNIGRPTKHRRTEVRTHKHIDMHKYTKNYVVNKIFIENICLEKKMN